MFRGFHKQNDEWNNEAEFLIHKVSDFDETKELKNKLKVVMSKLSIAKKEKDQLQKQNKNLQQQVIHLQTNLRQMISGFSNTSSYFPMYNQIVVKVAEFYKYDCLDKFFDILCPQLNMKGIIFFFSTAFNRLTILINQYMMPMINQIKKTGCFTSIQGPIMNVIRKAFQNNYKLIYQSIFNKQHIKSIVNQIQINLKLGSNLKDINQDIAKFIYKLGQLLFILHISDPPFKIATRQIGEKVYFNGLRHDPFDGFIKSKQQSYIILPQVCKQNNEISIKSMVLQTTYDLIN